MPITSVQHINFSLYSQFCSADGMFVECDIGSFDAVKRRYAYIIWFYV